MATNVENLRRATNFRRCLEEDQKLILKPDYERPFGDFSDKVRRLLPYHLYFEPDLKSEILQKGNKKKTIIFKKV